uniref:Collagen alpha-1(X) chain-like n=1 Tax=Callorhinus ursinus TaxID=34884 RepID=A0A3Q7P307_CALUR|nr:collagen alpha-1(X) chain-like [Callorhinus ursinus]
MIVYVESPKKSTITSSPADPGGRQPRVSIGTGRSLSLPWDCRAPNAPGPRGERRGHGPPGSATAAAAHERGSQGPSSRGSGSDTRASLGAGIDTSAGPLSHCQPGSRRPACDIHRRERLRPPPQSPPQIAPRLPALGFHAASAAGLRSSPPLRGGARTPRSYSALAPSRPRRPRKGPAPPGRGPTPARQCPVLIGSSSHSSRYGPPLVPPENRREGNRPGSSQPLGENLVWDLGRPDAGQGL